MIRKILVSVLAVEVIVVFAAIHLLRMWEQPLNVPEAGYHLLVEQGDSLRKIAEKLEADGVLSHPWLMIVYSRLFKFDKDLKQGEYLLPSFSTAESLLVLLRTGRTVKYLVTIPEGVTLRKAMEILAGSEHIRVVTSGPDDRQVLDLVAPHTYPEGLFFPDTYSYSRNDTDFAILRRAYSRMSEILAAEWHDRESEITYESPYHALIMASIIERETGLEAERTQISGVFVRRLQLGMRLQTDPTVIYGLGDNFDGNLLREHLREADNPYNTYQHSGLPPTPISLPGRASIAAALHPAAGDALYFVARGDGGHEFNATLAGHQAAVRKYQLNRKASYRSSP